METLLIVGAGGFAGAVVRYLVSVWAVERFGGAFPWGTLLINLSGSFLLAVFLAWAAGRTTLDPRLRFLIGVGFFGAYTTFSTYASDALGLATASQWIAAAGYVLGTNALCLIGAGLGLLIGRSL